MKKIIIHFWHWFYLRGLFTDLNNKVIIFVLHRIESPEVIEKGHSPQFLDEALVYLKGKGYNFVSLEHVFDAVAGKVKLPKKSIVFTMDDGFEDQAEIAAPIFIKHQCPVTIFLITNFIDTKNPPWDSIVKHIFINTKEKEIKVNIGAKYIQYHLDSMKSRYLSLRDFREKCKEFQQDDIIKVLNELMDVAKINNISFPIHSAKPITWQKARELEKHGVSFAPHTENHIILSHASDELSTQEINGAWKRINDELLNPCPVYAYPTGRKQDFSGRDVSIIKALNMKGAVTTQQGYIPVHEVTEADKFLVKRIGFPDSLEELIQYTSGLEAAAEKIKRFIFDLNYHGKKYILMSLLNHIGFYLGFYQKYESVEWGKVKRLVFVCKGNICRSAYGEIKSKELGLNSISVGLITKEGSSANRSAVTNASYRGIALNEHRARLIDSIEISESDLVICMEPWHINFYKKHSEVSSQVTLLGLWCKGKRVAVSDPYGKPDYFFDDCFHLIDEALNNINNYLKPNSRQN